MFVVAVVAEVIRSGVSLSGAKRRRRKGASARLHKHGTRTADWVRAQTATNKAYLHAPPLVLSPPSASFLPNMHLPTPSKLTAQRSTATCPTQLTWTPTFGLNSVKPPGRPLSSLPLGSQSSFKTPAPPRRTASLPTPDSLTHQMPARVHKPPALALSPTAPVPNIQGTGLHNESSSIQQELCRAKLELKVAQILLEASDAHNQAIALRNNPCPQGNGNPSQSDKWKLLMQTYVHKMTQLDGYFSPEEARHERHRQRQRDKKPTFVFSVVEKAPERKQVKLVEAAGVGGRAR